MSECLKPCVCLFLFSVSDQAGGSPAADEWPARQSVRAAGPSSSRPGEEQPAAGAGEPHVPAQDPEVRISPALAGLKKVSILNALNYW